MNKILKYLKKNIYLVCLILALSYIAYNKLYKYKEHFSYDDIIGDYDHPGMNQHLILRLKKEQITIPDDIEEKKSFILNKKILSTINNVQLTKIASNSEFLMIELNKIRMHAPILERKNNPPFIKVPYYLQYLYFMDESQIQYILQNLNKNIRFVNLLKNVKSKEILQKYIPNLLYEISEEFCKITLKDNLRYQRDFVTCNNGLKTSQDKSKIKDGLLKGCQEKIKVCEENKTNDKKINDKKIDNCMNRSLFSRLFNKQY
jgi:hypothetical protein